MEKIGKYTILDKLGEGGMGTVYRALDSVMARTVAIKTMLGRLDSDQAHRDRFFREARAAGQLNHKNIITVYDFGEEGGRVYLAMEYLEGEDLKAKIVRRQPMCLEEKLQLIVQVCEGLLHAHNRQVIHRDIKPGNIFVTVSGQVKILDFGLAHYVASEVTKSGTMGTPSYSSPELVRGDPVDNRADIFAAGAVFYELLTYRKAFPGDSYPTILFKILQTDPDPLSSVDPAIPLELSNIIMRALTKQPEQRYQRIDEMLEALEHFRGGLLDRKQRALDEVMLVYKRISGLLEENARLLRGEAEQFEVLIQSEPFSSCFMTNEQETGSGRERALNALEYSKVLDVRDRLEQEEKRLILLLPERSKSLGLLVEATALDRSGKIEDAIRVLGKILSADPEYLNAELLRQKVLAKLEMQKAQQEKAREAEELFQKASLKFASGEFAECQDLLQRALSIKPDHSLASSLLGQARDKAEQEKKRRAAEESVAAAQQALEAGDLPQARKNSESALSLVPGKPDALAILQEVERTEEELRAREQKISSLLQDARTFAASADDEQALARLYELLTLEPGHSSALDLKKEVSQRIEERRIQIKSAAAAEAPQFKKPSRIKGILIALSAIIVIAICAVILRVFFFPPPPTSQTIRVDASPWAKVTIFSEKKDKVVRPENETPFQAQLPLGNYTFAFAHESESRDVPVTVTRESMNVIRCDFWTEEQLRSLLPAFKW